jgi:hypothetical protein
MKFLGFLSLLGMCTLIAACDSQSGPSITLGTMTVPPVGTTYTYTEVDLDEQGQVVPGSEFTWTDSVAEIGGAHYGKNNVMVITDPGYPPGQWSSYFNFESNGDISEYQNFGGAQIMPNQWVTYPVASQGKRTYLLADTSFLYQGQQAYYKATMEVANEGISSMAIYDSALALVKIKMTGTVVATLGGQTDNTSVVEYYYFAPAIGYIAKRESSGQPSQDIQGWRETLVAFKIP